MGQPRLTVLDVGEGDAILLRDGEHTLLIDAGPSPDALSEALARQGVSKLDAVVLTHLHPDHSGGTDGLYKTVPFRDLYAAAGFEAVVPSPTLAELESAAGRSAKKLAAGDRLKVGDIEVQVVWPPLGVDLQTQNENSLVALVRTTDATVLLAADAEAPVLQKLIESEKIGKVDVLKIGHHASKGSLSQSILSALSPKYAVVSVGENPYGYPSAFALDLLKERGITTLRTDRAGDVTIGLGAPGAVLEN
jgi:competence protein ComEC